MPPAAQPSFDATELLWIFDPGRARILWANEAALAFWGERRLGDLQARPFLPGDPNTEAMTALLRAAPEESAKREAGAGALEPTEIETTFFPDGAPVRLLCQALARRRAPGEEAGSVWLAVQARPPAPLSAGASRAELMIDGADTAFALMDPAGAPIFLNQAARRLFGAEAGVDLPSLFERHLDPDRARRAANAALMRGAFAHPAEISSGGARSRALILYRRLLDPVSGAALLSLEAIQRPGTSSWPGVAAADLLEGEERIGLALFDASTLRCREANPAFIAMLSPAAVTGAPLAQLFPDNAERVRDAAEALRKGADPQPLDLALGDDGALGPWGAGRLSRAPGPGAPGLLLTLIDLGPERRRLLLNNQAHAAASSSLAALGLALVYLGPGGRLLRADPAVASALGVSEEALDAAIEAGIDLPSQLAAPEGEALAKRLETLFEGGPDAAPEPPFDAVLTGAGGPRPVRLSLSAPIAFGRKELCAALDLRDRPAAPHEIAAMEGSGAQRAAAPFSARTGPGVAHAIRTALTTIKGFAELVRDDADTPLAPMQRQRIEDIAETATALAGLVERVFDAPPADMKTPRSAAIDLAEIIAAAAERSGARHPVLSAGGGEPSPALAGRADLDEALDLLLAEAADRGPVRLTCGQGPAGPMIELDAAPSPTLWPPLILRAAELLIERSGGRLEVLSTAESAAGLGGLRLLFPAPQQG